MGIATFIVSKEKQTIVYWGTPVNNGRGKNNFTVVEELTARWEDFTDLVSRNSVAGTQIDKDGVEFVPNSAIYTTQLPTGGWDLSGYVYLGTLAALDSDPSPYDTDGAYEIKQIKVLTSLNDTSKKLFEIYV